MGLHHVMLSSSKQGPDKNVLTVAEIQQLQKNMKIDLEKNFIIFKKVDKQRNTENLHTFITRHWDRPNHCVMIQKLRISQGFR